MPNLLTEGKSWSFLSGFFANSATYVRSVQLIERVGLSKSVTHLEVEFFLDSDKGTEWPHGSMLRNKVGPHP